MADTPDDLMRRFEERQATKPPMDRDLEQKVREEKRRLESVPTPEPQSESERVASITPLEPGLTIKSLAVGHHQITGQRVLQLDCVLTIPLAEEGAQALAKNLVGAMPPQPVPPAG